MGGTVNIGTCPNGHEIEVIFDSGICFMPPKYATDPYYQELPRQYFTNSIICPKCGLALSGFHVKEHSIQQIAETIKRLMEQIEQFNAENCNTDCKNCHLMKLYSNFFNLKIPSLEDGTANFCELLYNPEE